MIYVALLIGACFIVPAALLFCLCEIAAAAWSWWRWPDDG